MATEKKPNNVHKRFKVSDESVNDRGFIMLTDGADWSAFDKNPVMLYMHNRGNVIGRWKDREVVGKEVFMTTDFDIEDEDVVKLAGKVERGYLNGASLAADVSKAQVIKVNGVPAFKGWKAKEVTLCDMGSNSNAVQLFKDGVQLTSDAVTVLLTSGNSTNPLDNLTMSLTAAQIDQRKELGLPESATEEQVLAKIKEQGAALLSAKTQNATLLVDTAHAAGKITDAQKPTYVKLAVIDYDSTKLILDALKAADDEPVDEKPETPMRKLAAGLGKGNAGGGQEHNKPEETDPAKMTFVELSAKNPSYLENLRINKPDEYTKLLKAYLGK